MKEEVASALRLARILDTQFKIGPIRFGLDPILGLVPGAGDIIPTILSGYILWTALKIGAPATLVTRMAINLGIDYIVGLVPLVGDIFDLAFKASSKNAKLLEEFSRSRHT